jgi:two-component system cell cycle sensor histidine kinase/response regulator CckA
MEDQDAYRYAAARALERAGFNVLQAEDYRGALAAVEGDGAIDLVLADIIMPKGQPHGIAVANMARRRRPSLKVLFMTAHYDQLPAEALAHVPGTVLRKPESVEDLVPAVQAVLA